MTRNRRRKMRAKRARRRKARDVQAAHDLERQLSEAMGVAPARPFDGFRKMMVESTAGVSGGTFIDVNKFVRHELTLAHGIAHDSFIVHGKVVT